jgi:hypothetical protein
MFANKSRSRMLNGMHDYSSITFETVLSRDIHNRMVGGREDPSSNLIMILNRMTMEIS